MPIAPPGWPILNCWHRSAMRSRKFCSTSCNSSSLVCEGAVGFDSFSTMLFTAVSPYAVLLTSGLICPFAPFTPLVAITSDCVNADNDRMGYKQAASVDMKEIALCQFSGSTQTPVFFKKHDRRGKRSTVNQSLLLGASIIASSLATPRAVTKAAPIYVSSTTKQRPMSDLPMDLSIKAGFAKGRGVRSFRKRHILGYPDVVGSWKRHMAERLTTCPTRQSEAPAT